MSDPRKKKKIKFKVIFEDSRILPRISFFLFLILKSKDIYKFLVNKNISQNKKK